MDTTNIPMEISIGGIYFPPIMFAILLGVLLASVIATTVSFIGIIKPDRKAVAAPAAPQLATSHVFVGLSISS